MAKTPSSQKGFTLMELTLVAAIMGIIASIAIPKFSGLITKAKEASVLAKQEALKSAINIYFVDNEGSYPKFLNDLVLNKKYLNVIPAAEIPSAGVLFAGIPSGHEATNHVVNLIGTPIIIRDWRDTTVPGGIPAAWYYESTTGAIHVACCHENSRGGSWAEGIFCAPP